MIENRYKQIKWVLMIILFANFAVAAAKIVMGAMINSASMTADGFHSITDGTSNIVGLIGIGIAAKPVDEDHPYGHKKYETITGLFIVSMLGFLGVKIIAGAIDKFSHPVIPQVSVESLVVMLITLVINIFVTTFEMKRGKALKSTILVSDAMHTRSDIFVTVGVLITLIAIKLGAPAVIDPIASMIVAGFILFAAYDIFNSVSGVLVDKAVVAPAVIEELLQAHPDVKGIHKIRSRGNSEDVFIDMHILAQPNLTLAASHQLAHDIEDELKAKLNANVQAIIHFEPYEEKSVQKLL